MIQAPKGVEDILAPKALYYNYIERKAGDFFSSYGYVPIRTPTFERTELFLRSVGQETDVGKQMYTFKDKAGRSISLRPEGTAGIVRAYIEHKIYGKRKEWRVYYSGPMFRYEKPQAGRLREFYQIGVECFGEKSFWIDIEIVEMAYRFLKKIGAENIEIQINSIGCKNCKGIYVDKLKSFLKDYTKDLCSTCKRRLLYNPLRVLDCKNINCRAILEKAPKIENFLCSSCKEHFENVKKGLDQLNISYKVNPYLVRGLDYYTRTIFEIVSPSLGAQNTVCAGGRYDDLIEELGGPSTPAIGFAIGVERLFLTLEKSGVKIQLFPLTSIFIATIGQNSVEKGMQFANIIRSQGIRVKVNFTDKSLSSQLKQAHKEGFPWVLIVGEEEIQKGKYILKHMESGKQIFINAQDFQTFNKILKTGV